jgi:hypothetical protein
VDEFNDQYRCEGFLFNAACKYSANKILLSYEYKTLKDYVPPQEAANFIKTYEKVSESLGYYISLNETESAAFRNSGSEGPVDPFSLAYIALGVCVVITVLVRNHRS